MAFPDGELKAQGELSQRFRLLGIGTFKEACFYVKNLPYGRNTNKSDAFAVFNDNCGTCSTKHALLKRLADENGIEGISLVTGIYKMDGRNTPGTKEVLERYGLEYIPEAHNYLKADNAVFDFTFPHTSGTGFTAELFEENSILPEQAADKAMMHRAFLERWLENNKTINLSLNRLWEIREECIAALSQNRES